MSTTTLSEQNNSDFDDLYGDELECSWCGGEGVQDNPDPLWYGFENDWIDCTACGGSGLRKDQTLF